MTVLSQPHGKALPCGGSFHDWHAVMTLLSTASELHEALLTIL